MRLFSTSHPPSPPAGGEGNFIKSQKRPEVEVVEVFDNSPNSERGSTPTQADIERQYLNTLPQKFQSRIGTIINKSAAMVLCVGIVLAVLVYCGIVAGQNNSKYGPNGDDKQHDDAGNPNDYTQYVNIWLGTQGGGNDNPAVARPFGMVKLGPDLYVPGTDAYSGYLPNGVFSGFSMMHEQGTGGAPKYGVVSQLPLVRDVTQQPLSNLTVGRRDADGGSIGYYKAVTSEDVVVELAAASRAGMYQYTFPTGSANGNVLVDVSHVLPSYRGQGLSQGYAGGEISVAEACNRVHS